MRNLLCRAALVLAATCIIDARPMPQSPVSDYPDVTSVRVRHSSLRDHKTHLYRIQDGFVVRRGQHFTLEIETSEPLHHDEVIEMFVEDGDSQVIPHFATKKPMRVGHNTYLVKTITPTSAPIGKYTNVRFMIQEKGRQSRVNGHVYQYPNPVYLIFNPYNSDEVHHIGVTALADENLLHEWGPVFTGTIRDYGAIHWYYGQFDQKAIDTAFKMLEPMPRDQAAEVGLTMQFLSRNIGCANQTKPVGNWKGVLYGRWFQDFPGGVEPGTWSSTIDIIDVWKAQGEQPAKYGQCWVFAAVQQTYLRALGIPARQVTALEAMIGKAPDANNVTHHVVNYFYDKSGKIVHKEGHCWNFHSWNDVHIKRKNSKYSGWNVIDGTPTGKGPGSVLAIHDIDDTQEYHVPAMIDSVHATVRWFLVNCTKEFEKPTTKGQLDPACTVKRQLKYNHEGVHLVVTKKPSHIPHHGYTNADEGEHFQEWDITKAYVDPTVDAYIPEPNYPPMPNNTNDGPSPLEVSVIPDGFSVVVGSPITAKVKVSLPKDFNFPTEGFEVSVGISGEVRSYDEGLVRDLEGVQQNVRLTREQPSVELSVVVDPKEYLVEHMHDLHVELRALSVVDSTDFASMDATKILLKSAPLNVRAPPLVAPRSGFMNSDAVQDIVVPVSNPFDFPLKRVCVDMFTPDLTIVGDRLHCVDLDAGETKTITKRFKAPEASGRFPVTFAMYGPYLPTVRAKETIVVAADDDHMRLSQL